MSVSFLFAVCFIECTDTLDGGGDWCEALIHGIIADNIGDEYYSSNPDNLVSNYSLMTIIWILELSNSQGNTSFKCVWVEMECESGGVDLCPCRILQLLPHPTTLPVQDGRIAGDAPLEPLGVEYDDSCFTLKESD